MMSRTRVHVKDESVLIVGTSPDYPPYESIDIQTGTIVGLDIDIIKDVARRLNKKVVIKQMPFTSLIFGLLAHEIDVIAAGMTLTPRRAKFVLFTDCYVCGDQFVAVTKDSSFKPTKIQDLSGKRVVVNTGYTADTYISNHESIKLKRLKTPAESLLAVMSGSDDVYVTAQSVLEAMSAKIQHYNFSVTTLTDMQGDGCAFAVNKHNVALQQQIDQALLDMKQDGTLEQIKKLWMNHV